MAVIHSYVFCKSYKYVKSLFCLLDSLAVALYKIERLFYICSRHTTVSRYLEKPPEQTFLLPNHSNMEPKGNFQVHAHSKDTESTARLCVRH